MPPKASAHSAGTKDSAAHLGFEATLWLAADKPRNNMDADKYKHVVLGLIFLKYISDSFEEHRAKLLAGEGDFAGANTEDPDEPSGARQPARQSSPKGERGGANQFHTPSRVALCLVETLAPYKGRIYDPACGSDGTCEVRKRNDEGRNRPQGPYQTVCAANHSPVRKLAEFHGRSSAGETTAPLGHLRRGELSGSHRGRSKTEFIAKCGDSLRELEESAYRLELLVDGEIVPAAKLQPLRAECDELTAIFVTIIKKAREGGSEKAE